jgi:hypothetical protein
MGLPTYSVRGLLLATAGVAIVAALVPPKDLVVFIAQVAVIVGLVLLAIIVAWVWEHVTRRIK